MGDPKPKQTVPEPEEIRTLRDDLAAQAEQDAARMLGLIEGTDPGERLSSCDTWIALGRVQAMQQSSPEVGLGYLNTVQVPTNWRAVLTFSINDGALRSASVSILGKDNVFFPETPFVGQEEVERIRAIQSPSLPKKHLLERESAARDRRAVIIDDSTKVGIMLGNGSLLILLAGTTHAVASHFVIDWWAADVVSDLDAGGRAFFGVDESYQETPVAAIPIFDGFRYACALMLDEKDDLFEIDKWAATQRLR